MAPSQRVVPALREAGRLIVRPLRTACVSGAGFGQTKGMHRGMISAVSVDDG